MRTLQKKYWNSAAKEYHHITRISTHDFHYGPQIPGERKLKLLPPFKRGQTALELGCGGAENSIYLSRQGLQCTAMDISENQLQHAEEKIEKNHVSVRLIASPLESFHKHVHGKFDFIHSSHAFEFVNHPERILKNITRLHNMPERCRT